MRQLKKHEPETELEKLQAEHAHLRTENALLKKSRKEKSANVQVGKTIEQLRPKDDVSILLDCKQMARSVFYYHRKHLNADDRYKHEKGSYAYIAYIKSGIAMGG